MPNYKSSFLWFPNIAAMSSFLLDSTDEDGLLFAVGTGDTNWRLMVWRKNSTAAVDNTTVFPANGLGRWIALDVPVPTPPPTPVFNWNSDNTNNWNSSDINNWNSDVL